MTGLEPLLTTTNSAGYISHLILTKLLHEVTSGWIGSFKERQYEEIKSLVYTASLNYISNYRERHGILKVLGMRQPISLDTIYTTVNFLDEGAIHKFSSIEELEADYRKSRDRRLQSSQQFRQSGIKVANENQYLMVLGSPGSGKSTFLRKVGLESLKGRQGDFQHFCLPVFLELKRFISSEIDIKALITEEFKYCDFPCPEEITTKALEQGSLLIMLDALDEVPTKQVDQVIGKIQDFVDRYDKNRFIASSRIAAYRGNFRQFRDIVITEFGDEQILQFTQNWFQSDLDKQAGTTQRFWEALQANPSAKELAHTPLLLTFLCLVYDRTQHLPNNRSLLYNRALDILLSEWAAEKRIQWEPIYQGLHPELEKVLLSEIAYQGFEENQFFFSKRDLLEKIKTFLVDALDAPEYIDSQAVLNAIELQQGILVERAQDIYSFSHITLQEYLTAQYISDRQQVESIVAEHITDMNWHEIFLLVSGLMRSSSDDLLLQMEKQARQYIGNSPNVYNLLLWADQIVSKSENKNRLGADRAIALYIALSLNSDINTDAALIPKRALESVCSLVTTLALTLASDLDFHFTHVNTFTLSYAHYLRDQKIFKDLNFETLISHLKSLGASVPTQNQPLEVRQAFNENLKQIWLESLQLSPELVQLSHDELNVLGQFIGINLLVVRCKQAAVRITRKTWEAIEEQMLMPAKI